MTWQEAVMELILDWPALAEAFQRAGAGGPGPLTEQLQCAAFADFWEALPGRHRLALLRSTARDDARPWVRILIAAIHEDGVTGDELTLRERQTIHAAEHWLATGSNDEATPTLADNAVRAVVKLLYGVVQMATLAATDDAVGTAEGALQTFKGLDDAWFSRAARTFPVPASDEMIALAVVQRLHRMT